jgi:nucleolar complex protein 2
MASLQKNIDRILCQLLSAPSFKRKKEKIGELMMTKQWKSHGNLIFLL